jgi:hypothetical protein
VEASDDRGISQTRGLACEMVAWRFTTHLTESEAIEALCYELLPTKKTPESDSQHPGADSNADSTHHSEPTSLLDVEQFDTEQSFADDDPEAASPADAINFATTFAGLNALELAAVADAKKFLSQKSIQRVIGGIWNGDIVSWCCNSRCAVTRGD